MYARPQVDDKCHLFQLCIKRFPESIVLTTMIELVLVYSKVHKSILLMNVVRFLLV